MTELLLVRHAQPHGGTDPGLTDIGHQWAERVARWLAHEQVDVLVCSPLRRAQETAAPIARALGLEPVLIPGLREWENRTPRPYVPLEERDMADPGASSLFEGRYADFVPDIDVEGFCAEAAAALDEIFERFPVERVVAVTHGGKINALLSAVLQPPASFFFVLPAYTSISVIEKTAAGNMVVRAINDTGHLVGERIPGARRPQVLDG